MPDSATNEKPRMVVQGAWISREDQEVLANEVKEKKLKSVTSLASKIIKDWVARKRAKANK